MIRRLTFAVNHGLKGDGALTDDPQALLRAIREFAGAVGPEAHRYLDLDEILRNRALVEHLQKRIEQSLATDYLPGFQFPDTNRFLWHLKNEQFARRYLLGGAIPINNFRDHWIRRFLLSTRFDYLAEVAHALQARGEDSRVLRARITVERQYVSWLKVMRMWTEIRDTERGFPISRRKASRWCDYYPALSDKSMYRWAGAAKSKRNARRGDNQYNGWYISSILYVGGQLEHVESAHQSVAMTDTGYLESWKWEPRPGCRSPRRTSLSFMFPAASDTWNAPDRKFHPRFI